MHRSINHDSVNVSPTYSAATEVVKFERFLFISGQVGRDAKGKIAQGVEAQAEIAWRNVVTCLAEADMTVDDIVDTMTFLVGRESNAGYESVRTKYMGTRRPSSTKIYVAGLAHPDMLCEVRVIAAK